MATKTEQYRIKAHQFLQEKGIDVRTYNHIILRDTLYKNHKLIDLMAEFLKQNR